MDAAKELSHEAPKEIRERAEALLSKSWASP
jgi:hypothetical protein